MKNTTFLKNVRALDNPASMLYSNMETKDVTVSILANQNNTREGYDEMEKYAAKILNDLILNRNNQVTFQSAVIQNVLIFNNEDEDVPNDQKNHVMFAALNLDDCEPMFGMRICSASNSKEGDCCIIFNLNEFCRTLKLTGNEESIITYLTLQNVLIPYVASAIIEELDKLKK